jgi:tetratricopeptide (TPR) repeat protein
MDETRQALEESQPLQPESAACAARLARLLNEAGRFSEALQASQRALERDGPPEAHDEARFAQGVALLMLERGEEAVEALETLLRANPAYPNAAWLRAGLLRQRLGDLHPETLSAYDRALVADPDNLYAQTEYADILRAQGRYREARDIYARIQSAAAEDAELRLEAAFKLGCVAMVLNETETARCAFRAVLEVAPNYPDAQACYDLLTE